MQGLVRRLLHDTSAATAVEYGLLIGIIAMSVIVGFQSFGNQLTLVYTIVNTYLGNSAAKSG